MFTQILDLDVQRDTGRSDFTGQSAPTHARDCQEEEQEDRPPGCGRAGWKEGEAAKEYADNKFNHNQTKPNSTTDADHDRGDQV